MRWLRSPMVIVGLALLGGVAISAKEHWAVLGPIAATLYGLLHTAVFVAVVLGVVLGTFVFVVRMLYRLLVGLICPECKGEKLQRLRASPFGRRRYVCRTCGAILWHHPFGLELHLAPPDPSIPRPSEALRYPPELPGMVPPPVRNPVAAEPLEGPAAGLAQLVAARRDRHHRPAN